MDQQPQPIAEQNEIKRKPPLFFVALVLILIGVFLYGLKWVFSLGATDIGSTSFLLFDYAVGLTMIFLPCTLPLAFVIVPLVMGKSYQKGIGMALAFGLGVTITLSFYGILIGLLGQALGIDRVETAKNILYAAAGLLAVLFGLGELGLIKLTTPSYTGAFPNFIMNQRDLLKAGLLGLFLGNVGVGCPNPLFNAVIIPQIVVTGSPYQGFIIMLVQALGRITPLFILAFLAILGINATSFLVKHKVAVARFTAWATVYVGGFLLTLGLFGHDWWVISGMHTLVEFVTQENFITNFLGSKVQELGHGHGIPTGTGLFGIPIYLGIPFLLFVWIFPMLWYYLYKKKALLSLPPEQQAFEKRYTNLVGWFFTVVSLLIIVVFGSYLPHMFADHWSQIGHEEEVEKVEEVVKVEKEKDFHITLSGEFVKDQPSELFIELHDADGRPILDLQKSHERILHVILISEDLEEFMHVHPEDNPSIVNLDLAVFGVNITPTKAGKYRVLVDANRSSIGEVYDMGWIEVKGEQEQIAIKKNLEGNRVFDEYDVSLQINSENPKSGEKVQLSYFIRDDETGNPVFDIEQYLGADMHLSIMPIDLSTILHTHGTLQNSSIRANYVFPYPGLWKIYGQFQRMGKVVTTQFMVEVEPSDLENQIVVPHEDDHEH